MTTERNASRASELIKEGTGYVRDGRMADAYRTFREVTAIDPNNEYAWIWISQTSTDRAERQAAINRALQINPNSQYAQQALSRMSQEDTAANPQYPPRPGVIGGGETSGQMGGRVTLPANTSEADDLRAAMAADKGNKKKSRNKQAEPPIIEQSRQTQQMTSQRPHRRSNPLRLVLLGLIAFIILGGLLAYVLLNKQDTQTSVVGDNPTLVATETTAPATSTTGTPGTAATTVATTTNPAPATSPTANAGGVALVPTPTLVSGAASVAAGSVTPAGTTAANIAPATTSAATTSAANTTAAATTPTASTTTAVATSPAATTPAATGNNNSTTDQLNQAQQLVSTGDYKGAIALLSDLVKNEPQNVSANFRLGSAYLGAPTDQLGGADRYTEALKSFKRVTDLAPTWAGGHARLGETYAAKGDLPNAITAFTRSLELDPNGPERWLALATLYDKNNQPAEAAYARSRAQNLGATPPPTTAAPAPTPTVKK